MGLAPSWQLAKAWKTETVQMPVPIFHSLSWRRLLTGWSMISWEGKPIQRSTSRFFRHTRTMLSILPMFSSFRSFR